MWQCLLSILKDDNLGLIKTQPLNERNMALMETIIVKHWIFEPIVKEEKYMWFSPQKNIL